MTSERETLGHCEQCNAPIHPGDRAVHESDPDSFWLCQAHAPMLSDIVKFYSSIAVANAWESYDTWQDEAEFLADKAEVEADLAANGDRSTAVPA